MFLNYMKKASPHSLTEVPCQSTKGLHYLVLPSSFKKAYSDITKIASKVGNFATKLSITKVT